MIKQITLICKKSGLSDEEFHRYWREQHGPLAARTVPGLRKYVQNHPIRLPGLKYEFDGFVEVWFDDLEAYQRYLAWRQSPEAKELLDDEARFIDRGRSSRYAVEERVIVK